MGIYILIQTHTYFLKWTAFDIFNNQLKINLKHSSNKVLFARFEM